MMNTTNCTEFTRARQAMEAVFGGWLVDETIKYDPWATLMWQYEDPDLVDIVSMLEFKVPLMLGIKQKDETAIGHAVFVFGYEHIAPEPDVEEQIWLYLFDPAADRSGANTSKQAKKWLLDEIDFSVVQAVDVVNPDEEHKDVAGGSYVGATLELLIAGGPTKVPEPSTLSLLLGALLLFGLTNRRRRLMTRTNLLA